MLEQVLSMDFPDDLPDLEWIPEKEDVEIPLQPPTISGKEAHWFQKFFSIAFSIVTFVQAFFITAFSTLRFLFKMCYWILSLSAFGMCFCLSSRRGKGKAQAKARSKVILAVIT